MPTDKSPLVITEFKGILRSDIDSVGIKDRDINIPFDYSYENENIEFLKKGSIRTRSGFDIYIDKNLTITFVGKPVQFWRIDNLNGIDYTDRWLILTWDGATGRMYDTSPGALVNPIMSLAGMKYAYVINAFGRMYISPWEGWATPLGDAAGGGANNYIWLYNGSYVARTAGCAEPVPGAMAVAAAAGGNCTVGLHLVSVIYETDTGARSRPPTAHITVPLTVTTTAANATINITNLPVAAAGTGIINKHIIITKIVVNNNNQGLLSYEPFIALTVPNATVNTSFAGPDSGLVDSAKDWVLSQDIIRSCVSMAVYGNRMVYLGLRNTGGAGGNGEPNHDMVAVSRPNLPEQVNFPNLTLSGAGRNIIVVGQHLPGKVMNGAEINNTFYVFKSDSTHSFVADDTKDPVEWPKPAVVDAGKGAFPFGIARVGNNSGSLNDGSLLVGGNHGITLFNGVFASNPITEGIWELLYINDLKWVKILVEPVRKLIIFRQGDPNSDKLYDGVTDNTKFYVGNYRYGFDVTQLKWSRWFLPTNGYGVSGPEFVTDIELREPGTGGTTGHPEWFNELYSLITILHKAIIGAGPNYTTYIYSEASRTQLADFEHGLPSQPQYPNWLYSTGFTPNQNGEYYNYGPIRIRVLIANTVPNAAGDTKVNIVPVTLDSDYVSAVVAGLGIGFDATQAAGYTYSVNFSFNAETIRIVIFGSNTMLLQKFTIFRAEISKDRPRA